jgi:hypothetical protein
MIFCHLLLLLASASLLVGTSKADWWGDFLDGAKTKVSDGVDFIKNEAVPSIAEKFDQAKEAIVPAVSEKFDQAKTAVVESDAHTKVRSWFEDVSF